MRDKGSHRTPALGTASSVSPRELSPTRLRGEQAEGSPRAPSCPSTYRQHNHGPCRAADPVSSRQPRPSRGTLVEGKGEISSHRAGRSQAVRSGLAAPLPRTHAGMHRQERWDACGPSPGCGAALAPSQPFPTALYLISRVPGQPWEPRWSQGTCFPLRRTRRHVNALVSLIPPHSSPSLLTTGPGGPGGPSNRRP